MRAAREVRSAEAAFISEVFHNLSQPLTALHCTLDLALQRDQTLCELRASVQTALDNAERLRQRLLLVRALNDAAAPAKSAQAVELCALLRELGEDMAPLFESAGRKLELDIGGEPLPVRADKMRLMQGLFVFVEYLFRYLPEGERISIRLDQGDGQQAEIRIDAASWLPLSPAQDASNPPFSCEIELLHRTLAAAGGEFELMSGGPQQSLWRAALPLVS